MGEFGRAAMTKCYRLSDLNNRNIFSYDSGGLKSEIEVSVGLIDFFFDLLLAYR